jgi:hypothetical protein
MRDNRAVFPGYAKFAGDRAMIKLLTPSIMITSDMERLNRCRPLQIRDVYRDYLE